MARGTKKVHRSGRFGARYGTSVRRRVANIERVQFSTHRCPECLTGELKRVSTSIWRCRKCDHKFAGGAYRPRTEAFGKAQAPEEELEEVSEEFAEELEPDEPEEPPEPDAAEPEPEPEPDEAAEQPDEAAEQPDEEPEEPVDAEEPDEADEADDEEPRDIGSLFED